MAIHLAILFRLRAGADREMFLRHAREVAAIPQVLRYVRNIVHADSALSHGWHAVDEAWVEADAVDAVLAVPHDFAEWVLPLRANDHAVIDGAPIGRDEVLPKRMTFWRRKTGMSHEDALAYWRHGHGPLAASAPGVRRYVQSSIDAGNTAGVDGFAQIWLESDTALGELVASPLFRERIKPDEANFIDVGRSFTLAVREHREVWPGPG